MTRYRYHGGGDAERVASKIRPAADAWWHESKERVIVDRRTEVNTDPELNRLSRTLGLGRIWHQEKVAEIARTDSGRWQIVGDPAEYQNLELAVAAVLEGAAQ